jgi:hypothetical protein
MVIDVVIRGEVDVGEEVAHVRERVDRHAATSDLAQGHRVVGVEAQQRRHVKGGREALAAGGDDLLEARLVSSAVPKPANIRIVHRRERYMEACTPRV